MRQRSLETILVLLIALGGIYWLTGNYWFLLTAGILGIIGLLFPSLTNQIHWLWMKVGEAMGFVTGKIVLTIIFYIFLVPLSFLARLRKRKPIKLKPDNNSFYTERNFTYTKESMENLW
jgi:hypothetical protein